MVEWNAPEGDVSKLKNFARRLPRHQQIWRLQSFAEEQTVAGIFLCFLHKMA